MRIAWLVPGGVAPEDSPDHNPVLTDLAMRVAASVELTVFGFSPSRSSRTERLGDALVHSLPTRVDDPTIRRGRVLLTPFRREHRERPFSIVHGFWALPSGVHATMLGRLHGIPSIVTFPGGDTANVPQSQYGNLFRLRSRAFTRFVCRYASNMHVLTFFQRDQLHSAGIRPRSVSIIPFGPDPALFNGRPRMPKPPYRFLHVSNLTEIKDQATLLRAFHVITTFGPATLRIIGPDHMQGSLQRLVADLGLEGRVEFPGRLPHRNLADHYRWADLYLHTSLHEGQSVSVLEAMASGTPVVGTKVGILADLDPALVRTVGTGDAPSLAANAHDLLADQELYMRMALAGQTWAHAHSAQHTAEALVAMYQEWSERAGV